MCYSNFQIRDGQYYRWGIVSRILALFGKYRISRYQGNLARFLWSQLPSLKYSLSLSSGSTGCSHLRKTVWLGKSWQSINYLEVTYWLFSIYSKNTLQVQYFANSPSYHLSSLFSSWNFPQLIFSDRKFCKLGYFISSLISSTCDVSKHRQYLLSAGLNIPYIFLQLQWPLLQHKNLVRITNKSLPILLPIAHQSWLVTLRSHNPIMLPDANLDAAKSLFLMF